MKINIFLFSISDHQRRQRQRVEREEPEERGLDLVAQRRRPPPTSRPNHRVCRAGIVESGSGKEKDFGPRRSDTAVIDVNKKRR